MRVVFANLGWPGCEKKRLQACNRLQKPIVFVEPLHKMEGCLNLARDMEMTAGILSIIAWELVFEGAEPGLLGEPGADYAGMIEGMEAADLLALMEMVQERLQKLGSNPTLQTSLAPSRLFIDKMYNIRIDSADGPSLPLRPLVKALFILFLKHPEGIRMKERARFESELSDIYSMILPNTDPECREKRIRRMMDLSDNSFSEKTSVLNARLEECFPSKASCYKVQGYNGHPRRIPLDPLMVVWL